MPSFVGVIYAILSSSLLLAPQTAAADEPPPCSGSKEPGAAALFGNFHDSKRDQKSRPRKVKHGKAVSEFVNKRWEEDVLNRFYRTATPLYRAEIFIPYIAACTFVKPSHWIVHHKGQMRPLLAGNFRFIGMAGDLLILSFNSNSTLPSPHPVANDDVVRPSGEGAGTKHTRRHKLQLTPDNFTALDFKWGGHLLSAPPDFHGKVSGNIISRLSHSYPSSP